MEPRQAISIELAQNQSAVSSSPLGEVEYLARSSPTRIRSIHGNYPLRDSLHHDTNNYGILSRWQSSQLCLLHLRDIFPYLSFRGSRRDPWTRPITPSIKRPLPHHSKVALQVSEAPVPRRPSNIDCCRYLPRPSASSPPNNRARPMANSGQVSDLEGLHREIHDMAEQMRIMNENNGRLMQLLIAANPPLPAAPPIPDIERSRHSNRSGEIVLRISVPNEQGGGGAEHRVRPYVKGVPVQNLVKLQPGREGGGVLTEAIISRHETNRTAVHRERVLRARISLKFKLPAQLGIYEGKTDPMDHLDLYKSLMSLQGCSDEVMYKAFSATLKGPTRSWFRKLSPGTIDSFGDLSRLFVANFMSYKNRQKNASHLFTIHQKEMKNLKDFVKRFNQAILEVEDPSDKVIIMAMMEGLRPGPLFDSLSKNVPETLSALQSKADKYIAAEELADAKRRRRGKDDHKRKEPDTRRIDYKDETRGYLRKYVVTRPPPNSPERRYGDNKPTAGDIQTIHGGFGSGGCSTSSRKKHARSALRLAEEEIYNLSSSYVGDQTPITFSNDDLRAYTYLTTRDGNGAGRGRSCSLILQSREGVCRRRVGMGGIGQQLRVTVWVACDGNIGDDIRVLRDEVEQLTLVDPRETDNTKPLEEVVPISIHPDYPDRHIMIGTELTDELRSTLINFLKKNSDIFAWSQGDVPGINPEIAMHKLFTNPKYSPVRQKRRKFAPECLKVIEDEVSKLIRANVVREAYYPDWLTNVVVAPQKRRKVEGMRRFHRPQ
ncbi:hypothetical protein Acr_25g0002640 [Actinidia rufa]|uniref:Retrotransposon gag domain-containing protein n=1 Tax=Actinidia rufa TaxID=165716 RepID=A0A7J0GYE8_9ERIC|nr:hypothetical protein Acr_25g0002640 [Actinidia rufa]